MIRGLEVKGGADELEAAVIAVVVDQIDREEEAARRGRGNRKPGLPAWKRAMQTERPGQPLEKVWPE